MKILVPSFRPVRPLLLCGLSLGLLSSALQAQVGALPVVTVRATDPFASWSGDTGTFTFFRDGPTNATLNVYYRIGGTASNGVDYTAIANIVTIPAGIRTSDVKISPINNGQTGTETVEVQLAPAPWVPPVNYVIGYPSNAVVYISSRTNIPPTVRIATPTNGSTFPFPANIPICAFAADPDGFVTTVEFFSDSVSLGVRTNNPYSTGPANPFCLIYSNAPVGDHLLTAVATDNGGASMTSDPVKITVGQGPPPTNLPPVVRIISPPNGAIFHAPVNVPIYAYAKDFDGSVVSVEFFAGTNDLGPGQGLCAILGGPTPVPCPTNVYFLVWSNAPLGQFALTAVATDNGGASTVSEPVKIAILPPPPPPTNRPPVVTITATDPIAIEGTNCWVWPGMPEPTAGWATWSRSNCVSFTNCGPKNATFTVRRFGDTNDTLTVNYHIGGTATNGTDYVTLPGLVTFAPGEHAELITVVPIDDGPPDITSTVVLRLEASSNYFIGFPGAAAAIIIDGVWPRPTAGLLPGGSFALNTSGPDGAWFKVEYSTDMLNWTSICTNQVFQGSIDFVDPDAASNVQRFYRASPQMTPPPR